jgi:hypothetical protein
MFWTGLTIVVFVNVAAITFTAFFKGYGAKKGENLATHEDIQKLVDQVRAVTAATEEIKAQVSSEQREWELKKEVLFEAVRDMATLQHAAWRVASLSAVARRNPNSENAIRSRLEAATELNVAISAFWKSHTLIDITFGADVSGGFGALGAKLDALGRTPATETEEIEEKIKEITGLLEGLSVLIRKDILAP